MKTKNILIVIIGILLPNTLLAQFKVQSDGITRFQNEVEIRQPPLQQMSLSVHGAIFTSPNCDVFKVTAYGSNDAAIAVWDKSSGSNKKTFFVTGWGGIYCNNQYVASDVITKKNINTILSPLNKIMKIRGVTFDSKLEPEEFTAMDKNLSDSINPLISPSLMRQMNVERKRKHMGVIAQEVEAVIPEVVRTTPEGIKAVAYHELVGLLIEAVKEQQVQISNLENIIVNGTTNKIRSTSTEDIATSLSSDIISQNNELYQNVPNPFSSSTEIKYQLAESVVHANLYIYDMQGRQIKNISNLAKGDSSVFINGHELKPGMYIYALIVDGKEIGTKRMILTD